MARQAPSLLSAFRLVLGGEAAFFNMAVLFGVVLSALTLGVPVAVQLLIDSIANLGALQPVLILSCVLFVVLLTAGSLVALQNFVLERFERRFFCPYGAGDHPANPLCRHGSPGRQSPRGPLQSLF